MTPDERHRPDARTVAWQRWGPPALLATVTLIAFGRSISFEFISDDWIVIVNNPHINPPTWSSLGYYWTHIAWNLYMPMTCMLWAALARLAQLSQVDASGYSLNPYVFHLASVLLHMAVALLVYRLLRRAFDRPWAAAAGAAVFAIHPIQTEAVCSIGVVNNALFGLFSVLAITDYLDAVRPASTTSLASPVVGSQRRWMLIYLRGTVLLVLSLLSKPTAVVAPLMAAALDWAMYRRPLPAIARSIAPWMAIVVPMALITKHAQPAFELASAVPTAFRPLLAGYVYAFYLFKILLPFSFSADYGRSPAWLYAHPVFLLAGVVTAGLMIVAWIARRRAPLLTAAIVIFLVALLPNSGLVPSDIHRWSSVSDRYAYIAMLGPAVAMAWVLSSSSPASPLLRRHALPVIVLAAIGLLALLVKTMSEVTYWHDDRKLFAHALETNPNSWMSHDHLSFGLLRTDPIAAVAHARIALRLRPDSPDPHLTLATALAAAGQRDEAIHELRAVISVRGNEIHPRRFLARLLGEAGNHTAAIEQYRYCVTLTPNDPSIESDLAAELAEAGQLDEAVHWYTQALQHAPRLEAARQGLALVQAARARTTTTTTMP